MLYHVLLLFYHNRSHSPIEWPKTCYIKNAKVIILFSFFVLVNQRKNQNQNPYMRKITLAATGRRAIEEAIGRQVSSKGKVAQRSRTNVAGEKVSNTPALQSHPGITP
jgi:hypothetical protein